MKQTLTYKGFAGSVEPQEDGSFYGTVQKIGALIMYQGGDAAALEKDFRAAVDDHLDDCAEEGIDPYNTSFVKKPLDKVRKSA